MKVMLCVGVAYGWAQAPGSINLGSICTAGQDKTRQGQFHEAPPSSRTKGDMACDWQLVCCLDPPHCGAANDMCGAVSRCLWFEGSKHLKNLLVELLGHAVWVLQQQLGVQVVGLVLPCQHKRAHGGAGCRPLLPAHAPCQAEATTTISQSPQFDGTLSAGLRIEAANPTTARADTL